MSGEGAEEYRVSIDFIACKGHGICAYLLPTNLGLDEWGYPIVTDASIGSGQLRGAKRAALMCPEMALKVERAQARGRAGQK